MSESTHSESASPASQQRFPSLRTIAMPSDTNPNGDIFGGWILAQMDLAGGAYAYHLVCGRVATVAITSMQFLKPVYVGDEVSVYCSTQRIGTTSITVDIETWVRRRQSRLAVETQADLSGAVKAESPHVGQEKVTEGLYTFVALDSQGKPRPINTSLSGNP